jgi:hypothetical protein
MRISEDLDLGNSQRIQTILILWILAVLGRCFDPGCVCSGGVSILQALQPISKRMMQCEKKRS